MMIEKLNETGEYIYLIQERESIRCNDNIYKIGKTKQKPMKRVSAYPTGSKLWITIIVNDSTTAEKDLLTLFKHKFKQITSIGNEYFYGNPVEMINEIMNYQISHFKLDSEIEEQVKKKVDGVKNETSTQILSVANGMNVELINDEDVVESSAEDLNDEGIDLNRTDESNDEDAVESKDKGIGLNEVKQMKPARLIDVFPDKISDSNSLSIDDECANEDIDEVINKIRKPVSLSRYTKILASEIKSLGYKNDCSANIYIKFNGTNIFDVDYVDIMNKNGVIEKTLNVNGNSVDIHTDADEDGTKIELNAYHINNKFKKVKVKDLNSYIINVCSFKMRKFKGAWYYKTIILPDKGGNK